MASLLSVVINLVIGTLVTSFFLWISSELMIGGKKATFMDALAIVAIGTIVSSVVSIFFSGYVAALIDFILWMYLIKTRFETTFKKAIAISIVMVAVYFVTAFIVAMVIDVELFTFI